MLNELKLLNQNCNVYSISIDAYGDQTRTLKYINLPCRFEQSFKKTINAKGDEVISRSQIWIPESINESSINIVITDVILYNNVEYKIIAYESGTDINGTVKFHKLYLL